MTKKGKQMHSKKGRSGSSGDKITARPGSTKVLLARLVNFAVDLYTTFFFSQLTIHKMPKATAGDARQARRHNPLSEDYMPSNPHKQKAPKKKSRSGAGEDDEAQAYIDSKASQKIISLGQDLAAEEEAEDEARRPQATKSAFGFDSRLREEDSDDEAGVPGDDDDETWGDEEEEEVEEVEVDPEDLAMFNKFNPEFDPSTLLSGEDQGESTNLADLILAKIAQHEASQGQGRQIVGGGAPEDAIELPAKVVEVYTQYVLDFNVSRTR